MKRIILIALFTLFFLSLSIYLFAHQDLNPVYYSGDTTRLKRVISKAKAGKPITIGFIGGSVTKGWHTTNKNLCYVNRVTNWFKQEFPKSHITLVNAGVPGMSSAVALKGLDKNLLQYNPDLVVIEFAVNDWPIKNPYASETIDQLTRKILNSKSKPAAIMLFMANWSGTVPLNMQDVFIPVGEKYHLPMISFRNYVVPLIESRKFTWRDIVPDHIHPNDEGHKLTAKLITDFISTCE